MTVCERVNALACIQGRTPSVSDFTARKMYYSSFVVEINAETERLGSPAGLRTCIAVYTGCLETSHKVTIAIIMLVLAVFLVEYCHCELNPFSNGWKLMTKWQPPKCMGRMDTIGQG